MGDAKHDSDVPEDDAVAARLARLETILQLAPVGIGLVDYAGHTTMTNTALHRMLGYTPEEFAKLSWAEFTHPDDVEQNLLLSRQLAAGEIDHFNMEKRFIRKDGGLVWTALTVSLVRDVSRGFKWRVFGGGSCRIRRAYPRTYKGHLGCVTC